MSEPLALRVTGLAAQHIRAAELWWRINRTAAPNAVRQELERAFALITIQPRIGSIATNVKLAGVRRIFMPLITYYLYYHVPSPETVEVVALWHARRGEGPPI
ncbi:MAG TPA: type II toxin-antitoxin system RelE/ParE family toxin [Thermoanaerobaculia bacterium]